LVADVYNFIQYAFASQALAHGLDPATAIREVSPRDGEFTIREEDILDIIEREGESIALVLFSGIQYYTGQWFPIQAITKKAQEMVRVFIYSYHFCQVLDLTVVWLDQMG
jgi:kynureninase